MPNNLLANVPGTYIAKKTGTFADAGILEANTNVVFLTGDAGGLKSYIPGRAINGITGFVSGKTYYIIPKTNADITAYLMPTNLNVEQVLTYGVNLVTELALPGGGVNAMGVKAVADEQASRQIQFFGKLAADTEAELDGEMTIEGDPVGDTVISFIMADYEGKNFIYVDTDDALHALTFSNGSVMVIS